MRLHTLSQDHLVVDLTGLTPARRLELLDVLRVDHDDPRWLPLLTGASSLVTVPFSPRHVAQGGGFVRVSVTSDYLDPYLDLLETRTGSRLRTAPLPSLLRWTYTHFMESCDYRDGAVHATMVIPVYPPCSSSTLSDTARTEYAEQRARFCLNTALGHTQVPPEFIPVEDGRWYRPNPDYPRSSPIILKQAVHDTVWHDLFDHWVHSAATDDQRAILARYAHGNRTRSRWPSLSDYNCFHLDQFQTVITWEDFKRGIVPPIPADTAETIHVLDRSAPS
jgi:hypothetical protein